MDNNWNCLIEQIKGMKKISEMHKRRLVKSVTVLRDSLGEDWWPATDHPLLQNIQTTLNTYADWLVSRMANDIVSMMDVGIEETLKRIRHSKQYPGAVAELEVGGVLARGGYKLATVQKTEKKTPDFLCKKNGVEFLAEVKTLETSKQVRNSTKTTGQVMAACSPIFPTGIIARSLHSNEFEYVTHRLEEAVSCVLVGSPKKIIIPDILKLYLVHPDDPDKVTMYDKWLCAPENSDVPDRGGLSGPPTDMTDLVRIISKIGELSRTHQIPEDRIGVLFITGRFMIRNGDVDAMMCGLLEHVHGLPHVPAVVLTTIRTFTLSSNRPRIRETHNYIDVDYRLAPYVKERVLIIKNRSCKFSFDYSILADAYAKRNKFSYHYNKPSTK